MALEMEQWKEILTSVNDLGESNIVEKIKEKLQQEDLDTYQEWREYQFDIEHMFKARNDRSTLDVTLLHMAALADCKKVAKALLMAGANINVKNSRKSTPLHEAADNNSTEVLEFLLTNGADVNPTDEIGRTPLHEAVISGEKDAVTLLIEHGANVNAQGHDGLTSFGYATYDNIDKEIVIILLNNGADVNVIDDKGNTTLHNVASYCHEGGVELVKLIIERGIDVNVRNARNSTPLHGAIESGEVEVVQLLVEEYKADVNVIDSSGDAPINLLYGRIHMTESLEIGLEIVNILIKAGVNSNVSGYRGKTFLHEIVEDESGISEYDDEDEYYDELVQTMVEYTILKNPEVEKPHYVIAKEKISEYWDEVRDEIEKMRAQKIDLAVTFYDILASKDSNELASYMQNKNITTELEAENYKSAFPLHADKIESQFHKGKTRKELFDKGKEGIRKLVSIGYGIELPEVVYRKAIKYLPNEDIENLNKAAENLLDKRGIKRKASLEEGESSTKHFAASRAEEPDSNLNDVSEGNFSEVRNIGSIA